MATTTNYSWTTPDDTDLVKDGAAAIRTLGSSIDTTVFNNAGAAIAKSLIDAEGDLIVGDAADAVQRLALGSNGNVLTVDTTVDGKIKWAAPASGSTYVGCSLYSNANQSISNATATAINFQVEQFDTDTFHDNSTNNTRITIPAGKAGKYVLSAQLGWVSQGSGTKQIRLYKNGSMIAINAFNNTSANTGLNIRYTVNAAVSDYYELYAYQDGGTFSIYAAAAETYFIADYLGA